MRVDLVITELDVGGAEQALAHLAVGLRSRGHAVRIFSLGGEPTRRRVIDHIHSTDIPITYGSGRRLWHLPRVALQLRSWLNESPADWVQSFLYHANVATGLVIDDRRRMIAGCRVADPDRFRIALERRAIRGTAAVTCVSRSVGDFAMQRLGVPPQACHVIGNGVDAERFANATPIDWTTVGVPAGRDVILFVGRLHPQKGLDLLWRQIHALVPSGSRRTLVLVGDGPLRVRWQRRCEQLGEDRLIVLPWTDEIPSLMRAARVLVLPSRFEGMPNVILEAMAAGLPVVSSDVEGSQELLGDDAAQRFVSGDDAAMVSHINAFLDDPEWAARTGAGNAISVREQFSIKAMVDRYESLYRSLDRPSNRSRGD